MLGVGTFVEALLGNPVWIIVFAFSFSLYGVGYAAALNAKLPKLLTLITGTIMFVVGVYGWFETFKYYKGQPKNLLFYIGMADVIGWALAGIGMLLITAQNPPEPEPTPTALRHAVVQDTGKYVLIPV